jgi:hypothetical protein
MYRSPPVEPGGFFLMIIRTNFVYAQYAAYWLI